MASRLEYHIYVRHSIPASVALFSLFALPVFFVATSPAQINAPPTSVTSPGFGGRAVNGPPASVTSLGPHGYAPGQRVTFSTSPAVRGDGHNHPHHHHNGQFAPGAIYAVPVPYAVDLSATEAAEDENATAPDADYQGGPTIFDRRGSGANSYVAAVKDVPAAHAVAPERADEESPAQDPTLLVFKDGRKLEVGNYAIVGAILFDLTPGHARKVALADLDLEATRQQNEDRGVTFQLPPSAQAN